jgi:hypothetical protein
MIFGIFDDSSQPTSSPSKSKSKSPTSIKVMSTVAIAPSIEVMSEEEMSNTSGGFVGLIVLFFLGLWAYLRCLPKAIGLIVTKKERGHLYDILVIVDDYEELILKNISHVDIAYFRDTKSPYSQPWEMNDADDVLEKHYEVEFFDRYDLMGRNKDKLDDEGTG